MREEPPVNFADGGVIRAGYNAGLDECRNLATNSRQIIAAIETRERERTGIGSLKVRFNNVFGYYIEISKANLHLAPADYERKQTLVNAERFTTPELKELEAEGAGRGGEDAGAGAEHLRGGAGAGGGAGAADPGDGGGGGGSWTCSAALAQVAVDRKYARPAFSETGEMKIVAGRHPVIEKLAERGGAAVHRRTTVLGSRARTGSR